MKTVLILGDSVSIGYRAYVKELLKDEADVVYDEDNGRYAKYTLHMVNQWIRNHGAPDVVHWNNGLWDICAEPPMDGSFTPLPEYLATLQRIIRLLRTAGVQSIIFATTTFADTDLLPESPAEQAELYNAAATALMRREGIEVNDLGGFQHLRKKEFLSEDGLHMTDKAYHLFAEKVAAVIRKYL